MSTLRVVVDVRSARLSVLASLAIVLLLSMPSGARAQNNCVGQFAFSYTGGPNFLIPGDITRVVLQLGTGLITGGAQNQLTVNQFRFELDCADFPFIGCADEGPIIAYVSDATITTSNCLDAGGLPVVGWSTTGGGTLPNQVIFTPTAPVVIGANFAVPDPTACEVQFDVQVANSPGTDLTPLLVQQVAGYSANPPADASCDNGLPATGARSNQIPLCPTCADPTECNTPACNQDTGVCEDNFEPDSTPCIDFDGNECTTAGCDDAGTCAQDHVINVSQPCGGGNLDTECAAAGCDANGQCDSLHIPVASSTPCEDSDQSLCTIAGCDGLGSCNQTHALVVCPKAEECQIFKCRVDSGICEPRPFPPSLPCEDTDNSLCTIPGCDGEGSCNQEHDEVICLPDTQCATFACDPLAGLCVGTAFPPSTPCDDEDGDLCTISGCDGQGVCNPLHDEVVCDDPLCEACDEATGLCQRIEPPPDPICVDVLEPDLDIKPGSCPNSYNRGNNGVLPVALVGTPDFDVSEVDLGSLRLSRVDGLAGDVAPHEGPPGPHTVIDDVATPFPGELCDCHEETGDGTADLMMKFKTSVLVPALDLDEFLPGELVPLKVTGNLLDGTTFSASDCVRLVPPGKPPKMMKVKSATAGAWIEVAPLDEQLDGGGFADFERTYPASTEATLVAEPSHQGRAFAGWKADGGRLVSGQSFQMVVDGHIQTVEAVYAAPSPRCGLGYELVFLLPSLMWVSGRIRRRRV